MNKPILVAVLSLVSSHALSSDDLKIQCIGFCSFHAGTPLELTVFTGTLFGLTLMSPLLTSEKSAENSRDTFTTQERESARFYFASEGAIEDAYFNSALNRFMEATPNSKLSKTDIALLISRQNR